MHESYSIYANAAFAFFIAVIVTFLYTSTRCAFRDVCGEGLRFVIPIMTLSSVLFALLATFTISNLWKRYQDIRQHLVAQLNKLRMLYRGLKSMEGTEHIRRDLKLYAVSLSTTELNALSKETHNDNTEILYDKLVDDILQYTSKNPHNNRFLVFGNLHVGESGEQLLTSEINHALYFVIILSAIFTLSAFWFLNIPDYEVHFLISLFVITIIGLVLYIIHELMNPFDSDLLRESFDCIYTDFIAVLEKDMPHVIC